MTDRQCQRNINGQKGFSLFEVVIVILLIGILMSMAIDRLLLLQIESERVSVQHVIGTLDSAVYIQTAEMVLKQGLGSIRQLESTNPMDYLAKVPTNYSGTKSRNSAARVPVEHWYFDADENVLVYKVKHKKYFETALAGVPRIKLKLSLVYRNNIKSRKDSNIQGIRLHSLNEYSWKGLE